MTKMKASLQIDHARRMMERKLRKLPMIAKLALALSFFLASLMYGSLGHFYFKNHLSSDYFMELHKCPACYGQSACDNLRQGQGVLKGYSQLQFGWWNRITNLKNVNYGTYQGKDVVYKKLAHNSELDEIDKKICARSKLEPCILSEALPIVTGGNKHLTAADMTDLSDFTKCPSTRLAEKIQHKFTEPNNNMEKMWIYSTLSVNPEPIIFQAFPKIEGWPFPEYIGACGRFVIEEYAGKTLDEYYDAPWEERFKYAHQIYKIADRLSFHPGGIALYLLDTSYENFAVTSEGQVVIIDAENIVAVDRWQILSEKKPGWDDPSYSIFEKCEDGSGTCLTYSYSKLCNKYTVDHNYYAVCRNILSSYADDINKPGGLLHDTPANIDTEFGLTNLLRECANPSEMDGRLKYKEKILEVMKTIKNRIDPPVDPLSGIR